MISMMSQNHDFMLEQLILAEGRDLWVQRDADLRNMI